MKLNSIKAKIHGLKSQKTPPPINKLSGFKNDLILISEKY